ncbi:MAG: RIP metalloprotease RseP [Firmicutes bacterium]|nr:RIP metalloprotease RseP [Bacillota bacterium]
MTAIFVILIFCLLVVSHEFGHFIVAKACNVYVTDFSVGMGPKLAAWQGKETQYTIRLLPVGGWCKMVGEEEDSDDPRAFNRKPVWQKMLIVFAGPLMNFVMAILLFIIIFMMIGTYSSGNQVGQVAENSGAAQAGLEPGDYIVAIGGETVTEWADIGGAMARADKNDTVPVQVERDGQTLTLQVTPYFDQEAGGWKLGIMPREERQNLFAAIALGVRQSVEFTRLLILALVQMFTGQIAFDVAGPVGIVSVVDQAASSGLQNVLLLTGYLCINLGIINLLPFPALDGCQLLIFAIEGIRRKPFDRDKIGLINFIGLAVLLGLMALITYRDIIRLLE